MPSYPAPAYAQGFASPYDQERKKQIDRTKTGVFLLLLGALVGAIPYVVGLGWLLIFIGAIFVILGRKAFGVAHSRNVILSILLFFFGIIIAVVGTIVALASAFAAFGQAPISPAVIQAAMNNFLLVFAIGAIVLGLASVFFTFALQNQTGKILLLAGYAASVVISIAIFAVLAGAISEIVATACPGGTCDQLAVIKAQASLQDRVTTLGYLNAVPSLLYAGAYYLVWNRVKKGEIPGPTTMPGMVVQPAPPIQPR
jgi:hypothetical protein